MGRELSSGKYQIVQVHASIIESFLTEGSLIPGGLVSKGLPAGSELVEATFDGLTNRLLLTFKLPGGCAPAEDGQPLTVEVRSVPRPEEEELVYSALCNALSRYAEENRLIN